MSDVTVSPYVTFEKWKQLFMKRRETDVISFYTQFPGGIPIRYTKAHVTFQAMPTSSFPYDSLLHKNINDYILETSLLNFSFSSQTTQYLALKEGSSVLPPTPKTVLQFYLLFPLQFIWI